MQEYDLAMKRVLRRVGGQALANLTGFAIERWHNVELMELRPRRVDMLGEIAGGKLGHIELQSTNESGMPLRMAEYSLAIYREFGRIPEQVVLYAGQAPVRMETRLTGPGLLFEYRLVDVREIEGEALLSSERLEDNIVAILTRLRDSREAVQRILQRIAASEPGRRAVAMKELLILAGLRELEDVIELEAEKMPILNDIMDHKVFGPKIRKGREEGRVEGRVEGERHIVSRMIAGRFGPTPDWARTRLEQMALPEFEALALRLLDARSLEELLG